MQRRTFLHTSLAATALGSTGRLFAAPAAG